MLEQNTGAQAADVVETPEAYVFVVKQGDLGKAIGKNGANLQRLERVMRKKVEFVEDADSIEALIGNLFKPVALQKIETNGTNVVVRVNPSEKGLAIGAKGWKIKRAREVLKRKFDVQDLKVV